MALPIMTNEEIDKQRQTQNNTDESGATTNIDQFASHLRGLWEQAKSAKIFVEDTLIESQQRRRSEYSSTKLSQMRELFGQDYQPSYMPITLTKCVAAESWLRDLLFNSNTPPYELDTTPEPDLPDSEKLDVVRGLIKEEIDEHMMMANQTGLPVREEDVFSSAKKKLPYKIKQALKKRAKELAKELRSKVDDQLVEGEWYETLDRVVTDIVTFKAGFLKGPIFRFGKKLKTTNGLVGVEEKVIPKFTRVSPFDIFPEPDSSGINDGYIFERISYSKSDIYALKGLDGVNEDALERILTSFRGGSFVEWTNYLDTRAALEDKQSPGYNSVRVDCLEFWGQVDGRMLKDWGMPNSESYEDNKQYEVTAWLIDREIIRALINPDPLGRKPYHKASWVEIPGSFWGQGVPEVVQHPQDSCNSVARAMVLNAAFASGPIMELNKDRYADGETGSVHPYKAFEVTNQQMMEAPAVRMMNATLVADRLIMVYQHFSRIADEVTVPSYAHGDPNVGGAGRTATGLSLLMQGASRGIKNVVKAIDKGIIESSIGLLYIYDLKYNLIDVVPDTSIIARGSTSLILRDQKASQLIEFANMTLNPYDIPSMKRQKLIEMIAEARGFDITELFKEEDNENNIQMQQGGNPAIAADRGMMAANPSGFNSLTGGSMPAPENNNAADMSMAGEEAREFGNGEGQ